MTYQDQFFEKLSAEYDAFIDNLKVKTPDEILVAAYEKVCKEQIVTVFEDSTFNEDGYTALLGIESLLDKIYDGWLDTDTDSINKEAIYDSIVETVERETGVKLVIDMDNYDAPAWRDEADREEPDEGGDYSFEEKIAAEIKHPTNPKADVINGEVACFDVVISVHKDFPYLVGEVNAVDKLHSDEHHSGNPHDDVFVDFQSEEYSEQRKGEIEKHFGLPFDEIELSNVRIAPDMLIVVPESNIPRLLKSRESAEAFCNEVTDNMAAIKQFDNLEEQLIARVEQNYADYNKSLLGLTTKALIDMAAKIHAHSDAWSYMTSYRAYSEEEVAFYMQFVNPLEVVADEWHKRNINLEDLEYAMDFVFEQKDRHLEAYDLITDAPAPLEPTTDKPPEKFTPAQTKSDKPKKPSITAGLQEAIEEAREYNAARTPQTPTKSNKKELD